MDDISSDEGASKAIHRKVPTFVVAKKRAAKRK